MTEVDSGSSRLPNWAVGVSFTDTARENLHSLLEIVKTDAKLLRMFASFFCFHEYIFQVVSVRYGY